MLINIDVKILNSISKNSATQKKVIINHMTSRYFPAVNTGPFKIQNNIVYNTTILTE